VPEALPLLRECHRILRPGGLLVIGTGNTDSWTAAFMKSRWEYFHIAKHGGHISFFNPASLSLLAGRSGFRVEAVKTDSVGFFEKGSVPHLAYRSAKIVAELLNVPSRLFGRGHDMMTFLKKT
jgi:SAM-dependent methyltransferase